jgi:Outer membrane protein beta-barrel family
MKILLKFLLCVFAFTSTCALFSQQTASITATVANEAGEPIIGASISLKKNDGGSTATTSGKKGKFTLPYATGTITISHVLYNTKALAADSAANTVITLSLKEKTLKNINVQAQKQLYEIKRDKIVFNVEQSITGAGLNAFELLSISPGVSVIDETVRLNGQPDVLIRIDGKNLLVQNKDLLAMLKSIQSMDIESIEISSNPSVKEDASGTAGIINIKLKKNRSLGLNGNLSTAYSIGITPKFAGTLALNYRKNKVNLFGNYTHNEGYYETYYNFYRLQSDSVYDSKTQDIDKRNSLNFKTGADFTISKRQTLGLLINGTAAAGPGYTGTFTNIYAQPSNQLIKTLDASNDYYSQHRQRLNYNVNYKYEDSLGRIFNADIDYGTFKSSMKSLQPNVYRNNTGLVTEENLYRSKSFTTIKIYGGKADWEQPLRKAKLSAGIKYTAVSTDNNFKFSSIKSAIETEDYRRSNDFDYTEKVAAAYLSISGKIKKWDIQAGLRMEHTASTGTLNYKILPLLKDTMQIVKRRYTDFFPNFSALYKADKNNTLTIAYSRRIDRPFYANLNPFIFLIDELSLFQGNPFLRPQYANQFTITHSYKSKWITTLTHNRVSDFATRITDSADVNKTLLIPENVGKRQTTSLTIATNLSIAKWYQLNGNLAMIYARNKGSFKNNRTFLIERFYANINLQNTFKLPANYTIDVSGYYNMPSLSVANTRVSSYWSLSAGVQKTNILKNRGSLRLSVSDIFLSVKRKTNFSINGISILGDYGFETRQLRATFSYRFGSNKIKAAKQRNNSIEAESRRTDG